MAKIGACLALCLLFNLTAFAQAYRLSDNYNASNFFDAFDFFTGPDPTHGSVQYLSASQAASAGLAGYGDNGQTVVLRADSTTVTANRPSVRVSSNKSYNGGALMIADLISMPDNVCGIWPALWLVGPNWPNGGEIDVIEYVNTGGTNAVTLHTSETCAMQAPQNSFSGKQGSTDCASSGSGCSIVASTSEANTIGGNFNSIGGGVYAMEWTSSAIQVWFFPRNNIPADIMGDAPNPSVWGTPMAAFSGSCNIPQHFSDMQIVIDTTFCGDWAGNSGVWAQSCQASTNTASCAQYVENNPSAYKNAVWQFFSIKMYQ